MKDGEYRFWLIGLASVSGRRTRGTATDCATEEPGRQGGAVLPR